MRLEKLRRNDYRADIFRKNQNQLVEEEKSLTGAVNGTRTVLQWEQTGRI